MRPFLIQQLPAQRVDGCFYVYLHTGAVPPAPTLAAMRNQFWPGPLDCRANRFDDKMIAIATQAKNM